MSVLNEHVSRLIPRTANTLQLVRVWEMWYKRLPWYERTVGSRDTLKEAKDRIIAMHTMNGSTFSGEEDISRGIIKLGSSGQNVSVWQKYIGLSPTGIFDNATHEATKNYQRANNLTVDGIVGPNTWRSVSSLSNKSSRTVISYLQKVPKSSILVVGIGTLSGMLAAVFIPKK